jgi:hypothetical protein
MPRQRLPKTRHRDVASGVVIRCECGKRLADLDIIGEPGRDRDRFTLDGVRYVPWYDAERVGTRIEKSQLRSAAARADTASRSARAQYKMTWNRGIKNLPHEDWWRVVCPKCQRDERGRLSDLVALVEMAKTLRHTSIALSQRSTAVAWAAARSEPRPITGDSSA